MVDLRKGARGAAREIAVFALFAVLSVVMTWPLALHLDRAFSDPGDPFLNTWILDWVQLATMNGLPLWDAPMFHPARLALAFSEKLLGVAWRLLPVRWLGAGPHTPYNIAMLAGFTLSGYGGWVLVRTVSGSWIAALVGGIFFAFAPHRFDQLAHLQHIWAGWLPILLAAAVAYVRKPTIGRAALLGATYVANALTNMHLFAFGSVAVGLALLVGAIVAGKWDRIRFWAAAGAALVIALALLYPMIRPYGQVRELYDMERGETEVLFYSANWEDWLVPAQRSRLYGDLEPARHALPERALFPGLLIVLLSGIGLIAARRDEMPDAVAETEWRRLPRWVGPLLDFLVVVLLATALVRANVDGTAANRVRLDLEPRLLAAAFILLAVRLLLIRDGAVLRWMRRRYSFGVWVGIAMVLLGVIASFGLNAWLHKLLFEILPQFRGIRVPARWSVVAYAGLAVTGGLGAMVIAARAKRWRVAIALVIPALLLFELNAAPIRWWLGRGATPDVYSWLATAPAPGAVFEMPMHDGWWELKYLYYATAHHRPLVNGYSGFETVLHQKVRDWTLADPVGPRLLDVLEESGVAFVVVHADMLDKRPDERIRAWLRRSLRQGRLRFVRRFDADIVGTWVFAVAKTVPHAAWLRPPEVPDGAGRKPLENLAVLLDDRGFTYTDEPIAYLELAEQERGGPMRIRGWAASPHGIRSVKFLFENESVAVEGELAPRADVRAKMPWYEEGEVVGFHAAIDRRPDDVHLDTDLVVEVVDQRGEIERLDQRYIRWKP